MIAVFGARRCEDILGGRVQADYFTGPAANAERAADGVHASEKTPGVRLVEHDDIGAALHLRAGEPAAHHEFTTHDFGKAVVGAVERGWLRTDTGVLQAPQRLRPDGGVPDLREGCDDRRFIRLEVRPDPYPLG